MIPPGLPKHTLAFEAMNWATNNLATPDGKFKGTPWVFTKEQALFLAWWYAIDEYGQFLYRNAVVELPKGAGKSPFLGAIACIEFMGPCRFDSWKEDGSPKVVPVGTPLVQICAISDAQVKNSYQPCMYMMKEGPFAKRYPNVDVMLSKTVDPGGGCIEKATASPRGREGQRSTFILMDETALWVPAEHGPDLFEALSRNVAKMNARWIATTNAHVPGEGSVAEMHYSTYEKQLAGEVDPDMLVWRKNGDIPDEDFEDDTKLSEALYRLYGSAADPEKGWIVVPNLIKEIRAPHTRPDVAKRFYLNQHLYGTATWIRKPAWEATKRTDLKLKKSDRIAIGFHGKVRHGAVCVVGCRLIDGALFNMGWWETSDTNPEISYRKVDKAVRKILDTYDCYKMCANPDGGFQDIIGKWAVDYNTDDDTFIEEWWARQKSKMAKAVENFEEAVYAGRVSHNDSDLTRHILSCHLEEVPDGFILRRETKYSSRFINGAQAAVLAWEARDLAILEGALDGGGDMTLRSF